MSFPLPGLTTSRKNSTPAQGRSDSGPLARRITVGEGFTVLVNGEQHHYYAMEGCHTKSSKVVQDV